MTLLMLKKELKMFELQRCLSLRFRRLSPSSHRLSPSSHSLWLSSHRLSPSSHRLSPRFRRRRDLAAKVETKMGENQRKYMLNEQLKQIKRELG